MKKDRLEDFYAISSEVLKEMKYVHAELNQLIETVQRDDVRLIEKEIAFLEEVYNFLHKWTLDVQLFQRLLRNNDQYIETVEGDTRSIPTSIELHEIPMGTENVVNQTLLSKGAVIFTSATLTIKGSFDFFLKNLGIGNNIKTEVFQSPYNYKENSRLIIAKDMPDVGKVKLSTYVESLVNHLIPLAETTKGRMLILFTSYEMLRLSYDLMKESGTLDDYVLMAQGITGGSKERLTKNFQKFEKAILFGTNTFWEGIDIPGEDLSCLVMVRLPFSPPDDPYIRAKSMELKKEGKNSFMELSLPEAVIRFKQGIGRLIRSQHDRGLIIIFDRRIIEARYGQEFLQSIPEIPMVEADVNEMISLSQQFL
ncbi:helicase C-terminal domain-containing protein [Bacillus coahuilensis]|uniref:helicase C-terminal domain-containing protein n=1 Tax=Bacillus coahuilensis TaxID=408580 RepID=UPI000750FF3A|nr:helicase C-terminal domain-containing protein [Bacillus coahuilensis]